jgi:hypothetical protein
LSAKNIVGENVGNKLMGSKVWPCAAFIALLGLILLSTSCATSPPGCPVCGTDKNATVGLIDVMLVPEHSTAGSPGGPFNIFDISWVDRVNRLYYVSDNLGIDVPMFNTVTNTALAAIGGDNSIAESGNNASSCFQDSAGNQIIPPITSAQGNYVEFGCKTGNFRIPGFFGPNGHFGGFVGGQCCGTRANNLNPLQGPDGLEVTADGNFLFAGNGSASVVVFDMAATIANPSIPPTVLATIVTGSSPDYDGLPNGITGCINSASGRAFSDPTCGDLRADEISTTGGLITAPDGSKRFLFLVINGDPTLPFATIVDATGIVTKTGTLSQQHCLPYQTATPGPGVAPIPYSPGSLAFPANFSSCILGQIYYDGAAQNDINTVIDDQDANLNKFSCPDPTLQFNGTAPGIPGPPVPSGASGHSAGFNPDVPCHHGPMLTATTATQAGGVFCVPGPGTPAGCVGAIALAGLGASVFNPNTGHFLLTNGNSTPDITIGSVDEIDPFHAVTTPGGATVFAPVVVNSFSIPSCMPGGISMGPGTDVLIVCAGHDGRQFAPTTYIINGTTGTILSTINFVGGADQGWYNPGDGKYYIGANGMIPNPVLGVIDAKSRQWLQNVPTSGLSHSVAADPNNNHVFVPLPAGGGCQSQAPAGCIGVFASQ